MLKTLILSLLFAGAQMQAMIDIDGIGINKQALFFGACKQGNIELIEQLINAGVDINALDSKGTTGLLRAIRNNKNDVVEILINSGAIVDNFYFKEALLNGNSKIIKKLIEAGADVNEIYDFYPDPFDDGSAIQYAAYSALCNDNIDERRDLFTKVLQVLLDNGADINQISGGTLCDALHNSPEILKLFIKYGLDINSFHSFYKGRSILMSACRSRKAHPKISLDTIRFLITAGADLNTVDKDGRSIFDEACENGDFELIDFLQGYLKEQEAKK
jgi:ankyrin repeat protein